MTALVAAGFALPSLHVVLWPAIGLCAVAAILVGIRRHAPRHRGLWLLLAGALLLQTLGDLIADVLSQVLQRAAFPSVADGLYLAVYFLIAAAMTWLARLGAARRDAVGLLDALTLTAGAGLLSWIFLISPYVQNPDLTRLQKAISVAYPLCDVMVLAVGARLMASVRRTPAVLLLALGSLGLLTSDALYGLIQLNGVWRVGGPVDLGWAVFYALWGAAALHPTMKDLSEPRVQPAGEVRTRRLILLGLCSLIAPTVLLVQVLRDSVRDGIVIALSSALLATVVLIRLSGAVRVQRRSAERERRLRRAGADLLTVTDADGVAMVVRRVVGELLPPQQPHRIAVGALDGDAAMSMRYTRTLPESVRDELGEFEVTLCCPLATEPGEPADGPLEALCIAAEEAALVGLQEAAQILTTQAALALQRIALSAEVDRRNSEAYFRTLVLNTADVILIVDDANRIRYASPSAQDMFGVEGLVGAALGDAFAPDSAYELHRRIDAVRTGVLDRHEFDLRVHRPDRTYALVEASCRDLRGEPTVGGLVLTLRDVTERSRLEAELYRQATLDALTALPNREVFLAEVQDAVLAAADSGATVGVLIVELDDFKVVNDTMGHSAGDELLLAVAARLAEAFHPAASHSAASHPSASHPAAFSPAAFSPAAFNSAGPRLLDGVRDPAKAPVAPVARLGGDEFAVLVRDADGIGAVERVAERILTMFAEPFALPHGAVPASVSIGVATTDEAEDAQDLLRHADLAVYVAKDAGKGRWRRYEASLHSAVVERLRLRADLDRAIAEEAFFLNYQPIVALDTGRPIGFEALVRWNHPTRGLVPPAHFIDLAEESGLIAPLGAWVLRTAIETAAQWRLTFPDEDLYVSVNVSARQFRVPGFVDRVRQELSRAGLPPHCLVLEMTESLLLQHDDAVVEELRSLRMDGVRIAIDDFGTGFSSLSYLRRLPVDVLKLDKSFIDTIGTSGEQHAVVAAIVQLAGILRLRVVAEGIETVLERDVLSGMDCEFGQGYLFSRPIGYGEVSQFLLEDASKSHSTDRTAA